MTSRDKAPRPLRARRTRRVLSWLFKLRGSPKAIGRGVAIGAFVAVTPTLGFQILIAAMLATILGANRPAAIALVWITNPLTIAPIYLFTYRVGSLFLSGPSLERVSRRLEHTALVVERAGPLSMQERLVAILDTGERVVMPLLVGGLVVGTALALIVYPVTLSTMRRFRARRERRKRRRQERRRQANEAAQGTGFK